MPRSFGSSSRRRPGTTPLARWIALIALAWVVLALLFGAWTTLKEAPGLSPSGSPVPANSLAPSASRLLSPRVTLWTEIDLGGAEQKVLAVLEVIDRTGQAPVGYRGGGTFMNDGRGGGQVLPRVDGDGKPVTYREWDVNPYTGADRGAERLVTGSDGSAWYTDDHYDTFVRIR